MTNLYRVPILMPLSRARAFAKHILDQDDTYMIDYRSKVKHLCTDAVMETFKKSNSSQKLQLTKMITLLPRLHGISFSRFPSFTLPWEGSLSATKSVDNAAQAIFMAIQDSSSHIRYLEWDEHVLPPSTFPDSPQKGVISSLDEFLLMLPCRTLETLILHSYNTCFHHETDDGLLNALNQLPLKKLVLHTLDPEAPQTFYPRLPQSLQHLELHYCSEPIDVAMMKNNWSCLRVLHLHNVRNLNLSYLTILASSCPHLIVLEMKIIDDDDPSQRLSFRDDLIEPYDTPTWPATLQHISLRHFGTWEPPSAAHFFQCLLDAAPTLPDLRSLMIKARITIPWKDRARFRKKWVGLFNHVFLRPASPPPDPRLASLRAFRELAPTNPAPDLASLNAPHTSTPRATRSSTGARRRTYTEDSDSASDTADPNPTHTDAAIGPRKADGPHLSRNSLDPSSLPSEPVLQTHVQGRCTVVDIRIDNMRPAEEQFAEADFLDKERSGDDSWDGEDDYDYDDESVVW